MRCVKQPTTVFLLIVDTLPLTTSPPPQYQSHTKHNRYATSPTEGLDAALRAYEAALTGPGRVEGVPPPVPSHARDPAAVLSPAAAEGAVAGATATDAAYELLLLAARGARGAGANLPARLLRCAGRTTNPLDAVPGWVLGSALRALGELPDRDDDGDAQPALLRLALDAAEQLLLLADGREAARAAAWASYAVLHLGPALAPAACREAAVRALLELTAPQWAGDAAARDFMTATLGLPAPWLAAAQAAWAGYRGDRRGQLEHLLAAGDAPAAHALFAAAVAPALFLEASPASVARLAQLAARLSEAQAAVGPSWAAGGGLYAAWCRLFVRPDAVAVGAPAPASGGQWRRDIAAEAASSSAAAVAEVLEAAGALAQQLIAAGHAQHQGSGAAAASGGGDDDIASSAVLTVGGGGSSASGGGDDSAAAAALFGAGSGAAAQRAVVARMSADVGDVLARLGALAGDKGRAAGAAANAMLLQQGCATLGAHQPLQIAGLAAQLAVL